MAQVINTNLASLNAQRNLGTSQSSLATSIQRLSSGLRVNSAKDDAAGLAIASKMDSQIRGMNVAIRNANDGISMAQTAEGALGKVGDMMQRMRELAVQSMNGTNSTSDQANLDTEYQELAKEVTRTIAATSFNGTTILASATAVDFQVGAGTTANDTITVTPTDMSADADVTAVTGGDITSAANAGTAVDDIDAALDKINTLRATWGAAQNRFESVIGTLQVSAENTTAARSRIVDADFAAETASLTRAQILQQAGTAMLSQANQIPQQVLSLLPR
jgi:flagellin